MLASASGAAGQRVSRRSSSGATYAASSATSSAGRPSATISSMTVSHSSSTLS